MIEGNRRLHVVEPINRFWDDRDRASRYDDEFQGILGRYVDQTEVQAVLEEIPLLPGMAILDAGCGTGRHLATIPPGVSCIGLDTSLNMLQIAKSKVRRSDTKFVVADVTQLPFKPGTFDAVISIRVLQHVPEQGAALQQFARVSKAGGMVCVLSYNSWTIHCLFKCLRHGRLAALLTRGFGKLLGPGSRSRLVKIHRDYYNDFNSLRELNELFEGAGMRVATRKGSNISGTWVLINFWLAGLVERTAPGLLRWYLRWCDRVERKVAARFPFNILMDKVIVSGVVEN